MKTIFDLAKEDVFTILTQRTCAANNYEECVYVLSMFLSLQAAAAASSELPDHRRTQELLIFSVAQISMRFHKDGDAVMHEALKLWHTKRPMRRIPTTDFSTYDECLEAMFMATTLEEEDIDGIELATMYSLWTSLMYTKDTDVVMDDFEKKYLWKNATK